MEILTTSDGIKYAKRDIPFIHDYVPGDLGEKTVHGALKLLSNKEKIFVDVGAHVGLFTLKAARECSVVIAIEPNDAAREGLTTNVELNGFSNVKVFDYAIADYDGENDFYCQNPATASALDTSLGIPRDNVCVKKAEIRMLDSVIQNADIIKIDIEGGEEKAIIGAKRLIRESHPIFMIEHHEFRGYLKCEGMLRRIQKLLGNDYRSFNLTGAHFLHVHKDTDINKFVEYITRFWQTIISINELPSERRMWYHGLPGRWWWGADRDWAIRKLYNYINSGEVDTIEWFEPLNKI